jgi:hypothetical protein
MTLKTKEDGYASGQHVRAVRASEQPSREKFRFLRLSHNFLGIPDK